MIFNLLENTTDLSSNIELQVLSNGKSEGRPNLGNHFGDTGSARPSANFAPPRREDQKIWAKRGAHSPIRDISPKIGANGRYGIYFV